MAKFNEILAGRYNRMLQKLFQLKGGPPASQLASEVMPVFALFGGNENRAIESWNQYAAFVSQPAVAANQGAIRMRNPVGSNVIAVVTKVMFKMAAAQSDNFNMTFGIVGTDLSTIVTAFPTAGSGVGRLDPRQNALAPTLILSNQSTGAVAPGLTTGFNMASIPAFQSINFLDYIVTDSQEFTIAPGDALQMTNQNVNSQITVNLMWRERSLEESELK